MNLGEQVKQKYLELFKYDLVFEGCTDDEIEQVKEFQNIAYIPQSYQDLLRVMGHSGLSYIAMGEADWNSLEEAKRDFVKTMRFDKINYPNDLLVFCSELDTYYFFRTKGQDDNPTVYGYSPGWGMKGTVHSGIVKLAENLADFCFTQLMVHRSLIDTGRENWEPMAKAYYDAELDEYLIDE